MKDKIKSIRIVHGFANEKTRVEVKREGRDEKVYTPGFEALEMFTQIAMWIADHPKQGFMLFIGASHNFVSWAIWRLS